MIACVVSMVLLFAVAVTAYPKELIGTWAGSCQQLASTNNTGGANAICTGSSDIVITYPYTITYTAVKSKTIKGGYDLKIQQTQSAADNFINNMTYYVQAYDSSPSYALPHAATSCGPNYYCITSRPLALGPDAFIAGVVMVGEKMMYVEQGIWKTPTNLPVAGGCAAVMGAVAPLYCNDAEYSYYCSGFKV